MKTARQTRREARQLFRMCLVNGSLDERRARDVVDQLVKAARPGMLPVLKRFHRFVSLDRRQHQVVIESAAALPPDVLALLEAGAARAYGPGLTVTTAVNPSLLGGVRVTVGSDVYDGSIRAGLEELKGRL